MAGQAFAPQTARPTGVQTAAFGLSIRNNESRQRITHLREKLYDLAPRG
jgi:hypothetical protein